MEPRRLLAAVSWDGGGGDGNWMTPANWSGDALPTAADDVTIDVPGTVSVTLAAAQSVRSLLSNESLTISGSLSVADSCVLNGATTVTAQEASFVLAKNLTINGTLALHGGISFAGNADSMIDGTGSITAGNGNYTSRIRNATNNAGAGQKLTVGADIEIVVVHFNWTVENSGGVNQLDGSLTSSGFLGLGSASGRFINNGSITTTSGSSTANYIYNLVNNAGKSITLGTYSSTDLLGTLLGGAGFDNNGIITANSGAIVKPAGTFTFADLGNITGAGELQIVSTLDLGGGTLDLSSYPLNLGLATGARISNGTIVGTAAHRLVARNGTLDNVTIGIPVFAPGTGIFVENHVTLNQPVQIVSSGSLPNTFGGSVNAGGSNDALLDGTASITMFSGLISPPRIVNNTLDSSTSLGKKFTIGSGISISTERVDIRSTYAGGVVQLDGTLTLPFNASSFGPTFLMKDVINNGTMSFAGNRTVQFENVVNNGLLQLTTNVVLNAANLVNNNTFSLSTTSRNVRCLRQVEVSAFPDRYWQRVRCLPEGRHSPVTRSVAWHFLLLPRPKAQARAAGVLSSVSGGPVDRVGTPSHPLL